MQYTICCNFFSIQLIVKLIAVDINYPSQEFLMANVDEASQMQNGGGANGGPIGAENTEFQPQLDKQNDNESPHGYYYFTFL